MSNNSSNHLVVPAAREAMEKFKMEAATEVAVLLTSKSGSLKLKNRSIKSTKKASNNPLLMNF